jgi:hypothetical protein
MGRPGSANMNYAMSPNSKRTMMANNQMMASKSRMNKPNMSSAQNMGSANLAANQAIPTPGHVSHAKQSPNYQSPSNGNMNYSGQNYSGQGQYAQQSNPSNSKYRVARKPMPQQNGQQMMYQQ